MEQQSSGRQITYSEAIREALQEEMQRNPKILLMGEDLTKWGNPWGVVRGFASNFGTERVRDTPISEAGFVGAAVGAALMGYRPVVDLMFADFIGICLDQISNQGGKMRYMSGGSESVPMLITMTYGAGRSAGAQHSQTLYSIICHMQGVKVIAPSTPYDVKGLMKTALREQDPVVLFEHKLLLRTSGPVPLEDFAIPFGKAAIRLEGEDLTIIATGFMVNRSLEAATELRKLGIKAEVIDTRTLVPLDKAAILSSVKKTGRALVVDEDYEYCGVASEIAAIIAEEGFHFLKAPIKRVTTPNVSIPYAQALQNNVMPNAEKILKAAQSLVSQKI
ncbi:MAG: alpha-ketoacid dehydrogenase subunit beta [Nitrososphaerales archaeon]